MNKSGFFLLDSYLIINKAYMLKEYQAEKRKIFRVMDNEGKIINEKYFPQISDKDLIKSYRDMLFARTADLMIVSYQRQGRIFTYPLNYGQEAIATASAVIATKDDWVVPAFRELALWLAKGASLKDIFLYYMGYEDGSKFSGAKNMFPLSVPIASQLSHATGVGYALKYQDKKEVVFTYVGDGGTSTGEFHEALNFAGVWKVPVIFIVQNNQYAISVPFNRQTASEGIAIKSLAYGMPGVQVDGNDYFAMYKVLEESRKHCAQGKGPVLIEAVTYRKGAHTTSDDPTKYRTKEEEQKWEKTDPLKRFQQFLVSKGLWKVEEEDKLIEQYKEEIDRIFVEAENYPDYPLDDVFKYMYAEIPPDLIQQKAAHEKFLKSR